MKPKNKFNKKHNTNQDKGAERPINELVTPSVGKKRGIGNFMFKLFLLLFVVSAALVYSDKKGYFNPDMGNNHTERKWDSFYRFSKRNNVDVLLLGNSHLYTGINPKNLSVTLGCNAFILASPGTYMSDTYWALREALTQCDPTVVVIETYGIEDFNPYKMKEGSLSDQFKSFSARKHIPTKLVSTPYLFNPDSYFLAWSNTLRNHNFILNNSEQLKRNKQLISAGNKMSLRKNDELYLGRYVRFTSGIQDSIIQLYETTGSPVNGSDFKYGDYAEHYIAKISELCQQKNIELVFLTLPMYEKHVEGYKIWQSNLGKLLKVQSESSWLDMQAPLNYAKIGFNRHSFENTYKSNQHMTYSGSLLATYSLASYIRDSLNVKLPNRAKETKWHNIFYGEEGYFEHFPPHGNDKNRKVIQKEKKLRNIVVKEVMVANMGNYNTLTAKLPKSENNKQNIRLLIEFNLNNEKKRAFVELREDPYHLPKDFSIYTTQINKEVEVTNVLDGEM